MASKTPHLGLICPEYPPAPHGGIGSYSQDLAESLISSGWRVSVLAPSRLSYPVDLSTAGQAKPPIKILPKLPFQRPWRLITQLERWRFIRFLQKCHQQTPFDLLECPDYDGWLPNGSGLPVPTVIRLHGSNLLYDHELKRPGIPLIHQLERQTLRAGSFWGGVSRYAYEQSLIRCGEKEHPGTVVYNAVDTSLFSPSPEIQTESGLIVFVNSLNRRKGLDTLLLAMPQVVKQAPHARLAIIGGNLPADSDLGQLLASLPAAARVRIEFPGRLDRRTGVVNWLRKAQIGCYPSRIETFGLAPVEAMSIGKPTIYSQTGPGPEVIEDNVSGLLCDPESPANLAEKLLQILRNPTLGQQLGDAARQRVLAHFDRRQWLLNNLTFYRECLGLGSGTTA